MLAMIKATLENKARRLLRLCKHASSRQQAMTPLVCRRTNT